MARLPFSVRRPWLVIRGTLTNRDRPDLESLAAITDPAEFVWAVLPHAARSFATSILVLPRAEAWAAAIAYLQCRILDTYEDLHPDVAARPDLLRRLGKRLSIRPPDRPPPISAELAHNDRDRVHLLLIDKIELIDRAYDALPDGPRDSISELVGNMAAGMAWAAETFDAQGGVLAGRHQRAQYCHHVIGEPALYAMRSLLHLPITSQRREDAQRVAEMIQLANITRDIERDLAQGRSYHEALQPLLGASQLDAAAREQVRAVRAALVRDAMGGVDAYARLVAELPPGISQARGAAVLMLLFTDRYYSRCTTHAGGRGWRAQPRPLIYANAILATLSAGWADRVVSATQRRFHGVLATTPGDRAGYG